MVIGNESRRCWMPGGDFLVISPNLPYSASPVSGDTAGNEDHLLHIGNMSSKRRDRTSPLLHATAGFLVVWVLLAATCLTT